MAKLQIEKQKNNDINITLPEGRVLKLSNEPLATYPVGTIIETTSEVSPAQLYGGTWEEFGKGKVLVGRDTSDSDFNTILKTGGEKTHKLKDTELPEHAHQIGMTTINWGSSPMEMYVGQVGSRFNSDGTSSIAMTRPVGENQPHNNLQPYIVVYRWRRIA